jgi:hypothetical protein
VGDDNKRTGVKPELVKIALPTSALFSKVLRGSEENLQTISVIWAAVIWSFDFG